MRASPDARRLDSLDIEPRDNAKVAAAAFQRPEKIRVRRLVSLYDGAVCQNNLIVDHRIAAPAHLVAVEVDTAGKEQTGHSDRAQTSPSHRQIILLEISVNVLPSALG